MGRVDIDWGILRGAVISLGLSLVVGASILGASYYFWGAMQSELERQQRRFVDMRRKYHTVDEEEKVIEIYLPRYQALEAEGVIGREHRLNWIETLREESKNLKLPALSYTINSQERLEPKFQVHAGKFKVFASRMNLTVGLLHEEDLLRLLLALERGATGSYTVAECSLRRASAEFRKGPTDENLAANCVLEWHTVKEGDA